MKVHVIIDIMHIFYRYKFSLESGKLRRLTNNGEDISNIYYVLKDIEGIRKSIADSHDVVVSICGDRRSSRKDIDGEMSKAEKEVIAEYKANRGTGKLTEEDIVSIEKILELLEIAGYNVFRIEGFEADDLVYHLISNYKDKFDYTVVYTNDADLAANIDSRVSIMRYKIKTGYIQITDRNYSEILSAEYKSKVPYNSVILFKCTCGDSSDCIKGIKGFGPKAFEKLVNHLDGKVDWEKMCDIGYVESTLENCKDYLGETQVLYAKACLKLVQPVLLSEEQANSINLSNITSKEKREAAYTQYAMKSLV